MAKAKTIKISIPQWSLEAEISKPSKEDLKTFCMWFKNNKQFLGTRPLRSTLAATLFLSESGNRVFVPKDFETLIGRNPKVLTNILNEVEKDFAKDLDDIITELGILEPEPESDEDVVEDENEQGDIDESNTE